MARAQNKTETEKSNINLNESYFSKLLFGPE